MPHQWRHRHLGEEVGITGTVLEAGITGTVLEAGITGTVLVAGITGARLQRPKVLTLRSPIRPMWSRIPHQWRHRHLGEEVGITGTVLEAGITGTVQKVGITGTVLEAGITGARMQRPKVLTWRS